MRIRNQYSVFEVDNVSIDCYDGDDKLEFPFLTLQNNSRIIDYYYCDLNSAYEIIDELYRTGCADLSEVKG